ncbi:Predicted oxidoreductase (fragment) [Cupriavidus taiwanensis]
MPANVTRRRWLRAGAAALLLAAPLPRAVRAQPGPAPAREAAAQRIGVIGAGRIGGTVGGLWVKAGHPVLFSSRHPEALQPLVEELGTLARAGTVAEAIAFSDVLFLATPYGALPQLSRDHAGAWQGKIVLDATNAYGTPRRPHRRRGAPRWHRPHHCALPARRARGACLQLHGGRAVCQRASPARRAGGGADRGR